MVKWIALRDLYFSREYYSKIAGIAGDDVMAVIEAAVRRSEVRKLGQRQWSRGRGPIEPISESLIINVAENSMRGQTFGSPSWSKVEIAEDDFFGFLLSFYSPTHPATAGTAATGLDKDASETGLPGRPTSKHLILAELKRRIGAGEVAITLAAEARHLTDWLEREHPTNPRSGAKSIENTIRTIFNAGKRLTSNPP